ncbi:hypothetical protein AAKU55_005063 [Oxalobacteraceae bacterium GrIS 1.11]
MTITTIQDNPFLPGLQALQFNPDQLIAGNHKLTTDSVTFLSGQVLQRGAVLGKITASGKYTLALSAAVDGSQVPVAIAADAIDASAGDVSGGIFLSGEFDANALTLGAGITLAAAILALRPLSLYVKTQSTAMSAADPT